MKFPKQGVSCVHPDPVQKANPKTSQCHNKIRKHMNIVLTNVVFSGHRNQNKQEQNHCKVSSWMIHADFEQ